MSSCADLLRFQLPGHEAAALRSMTRLRAEERFCDVTIVARSLRFRGHRVILAACSPFLRDQFLLNPAAELRVSLAHSARVLADLLLSCYTGALEFAGRDLVNYLTAASYLQMEHVVERCRGALARFIQPSPSAPVQPPKNEEDEEDEDEEDTTDVCIVKVEPATRRRGRRWPVVAASEVVTQGPAGVTAVVATAPDNATAQLGVVKACYSLAEDAEGEGLVIFPGGGGGGNTTAATSEEPPGSQGAVGTTTTTTPTPSSSSSSSSSSSRREVRGELPGRGEAGVPHEGPALRVHVPALRQAVQPQQQPEPAHERAPRREVARLRRLRQELHAEIHAARPPEPAQRRAALPLLLLRRALRPQAGHPAAPQGAARQDHGAERSGSRRGRGGRGHALMLGWGRARRRGG
uniref:Uncharacterized protein n=1 Tax=Geospiza parvula TaxID=87175 RepID=A0A8U8BFZ4_GEOPR